MPFEAPQFTERIQAERPEVHEELLHERLAEISLRYLRMHHQEHEGVPLSEQVGSMTPIDVMLFHLILNSGKPSFNGCGHDRSMQAGS